MWSNLIIFHCNDENRFKDISFEDKNLFHWKTCMRTIYIGDKRISKDIDILNYKKFYGYNAYQFLLETVCGFYSNLFGETEVMKQFKVQFDDKNLSKSPFHFYLKKLKNYILEDAKYIRSQYLQNRGEQSYGGLIRKYTQNIRKITLIGTGQLAEKILPWIVENKMVQLVGRNQERLNFLTKKYPIVQIQKLEPEITITNETVIIAAPIPYFINNSFYKRYPKKIIDFRDKTFDEIYPYPIEYISFQKILSNLKKTNEKNQQIKIKISTDINNIIYRRKQEPQYLIHCLDDIYAI